MMTQPSYNSGLWGLGLSLALAIIVSVYFITATAETFLLHRGKMTVKGYAEKEIASDYVTWSGNFTTRAPTLQKAYEQLEKDSQVLLSYLNQKGIESKYIELPAIQTSIQYVYNAKGQTTGEIESYTLTQDFVLQSVRIELVSEIANQVTSLIKEGLEIVSFKPQYFYTKLDELKVGMLGEAAKDALTRAQQLATNSGSQIGQLQSAHQGVFQITPLFSTSVSDYGENDTSSFKKKIKAVVTMEYSIHKK